MARLTESAEVREEIVRALRLDLIGPWASGPQRMFRAGRNQKAAAYVDKVRLGQTEPGSFVVNMLVPVSPSLTEPEPTQLPLLEPFERRATRMLVSGLRASREATELVNRGERALGRQTFAHSKSGSARASVRTCAKPPPI